MRLFFLLTTICAIWGKEPLFPFAQEDAVSTAVDSSGNTLSVWVEKDQVWASESVAIGSWSMPTLLSSPQGKASSPQIKIAPSGEAVAVWLEDNSVKAATRTSFGEWKPSLIAPTSSKNDPKPFDFSLSGHPLLRLKPKKLEDDEDEVVSAGKMRGKVSKENQIEALSVNAIDAPTGKNLTGAQIGFAVGQAAPSDGLIVSGVSGFGISAPSVQTQVTISPFSSAQIKGLLITGSFSGVAQAGISSSATYTNNASNFAQSVISSPVFAAAGATTISNASCFYASPFLTGNAGTVSTMSGIYYDGGGPLVGTVTFSYGGFFANPAAGTTKVALYADNEAIGFSGVTPPTNGLVISGRVGIGSATNIASAALSIFNTYLDTTGGTGIYLASDMTSSTNNDTLTAIYTRSTNLKSIGTGGTVYGMQLGLSSIVANSGLYYGIKVFSPISAGGTYTQAYSGYFQDPSIVGATAQTALYSDNEAIGYTATTPPTHSLIVSGVVGVKDTAPGSTLSVVGKAQIGFSAGTSAPTNGLIVNGNTGIGTTVPSTTFNVLGSSTVEAGSEIGSILLSGTKTGTGTIPRFATGINYDGTTMNYAWMQSVETGSGARHLAIQPDGARGVVIGSTVNPLNTLSVGGNFTVGANYVAVSAPTNGAIIQGKVGIGVTSIDARATLQVAGTIMAAGWILPTTTKIYDLGTPDFRWNNVYIFGSVSAGNARLAPAKTICPSCNKSMMMGTGTFYTIGDGVDYIPVFCPDCGTQKVEALSHLSEEKRALKRPPSTIVFLGFSVNQHSPNSRSIHIRFSYGNGRENATIFSDREYEQFLTMNKSDQHAFLKKLGRREWDAMEEIRLLREECTALQSILNELGKEWQGIDLLK